MTKRFTAIILIANVIIGLLLFLSSQLMLSELNGTVITSYSLTLIGSAPQQVGQVIVPIEMALPNFPFYVFILFLIVNACFIIKMLSEKSKQPLS